MPHGDEPGRTQDGNNNGYCQDNPITWVDWADADTALTEFLRQVSALRSAHPVRSAAAGSSPASSVRSRDFTGLPDISWFLPDGPR